MVDVSRRNFLKTAGLSIAGATLACAGFTYGATYTPKRTLPISDYGDQFVDKHILIVYATKCGSTAEIAQAIGESVAKSGALVEVRPVSKVTSVAEYDAVIAGSAIRYGAWLTEATEFLMENQEQLSVIPTAVFTVHMLNLDDTEEDRKVREGYLTTVNEYIHPISAAFFAGNMDFSKLSFFEKIVSKAVNAVEADKRDWDTIRTWGTEMGTVFSKS